MLRETHSHSFSFSRVGKTPRPRSSWSPFSSRLSAKAPPQLLPLAEPGHEAKLVSGHGSLGARVGTVLEALFRGPEASPSAGIGRSWPQPRLRGILGYSLHLPGDPGIQPEPGAPQTPTSSVSNAGSPAFWEWRFPIRPPSPTPPPPR